jgi:hypothetical protein
MHFDVSQRKMIRTHLEPALRQRFSSQPFEIHQENAPFATLDAPCAGIGRLELCDDGDEVTVYLTELTHGHFGCYEDDLSTEEKERAIASDVVDFLDALFADRVVAYRVIGGFAGGWRLLDDGEDLPPPSKLKSQYVWSHPIEHKEIG